MNSSFQWTCVTQIFYKLQCNNPLLPSPALHSPLLPWGGFNSHQQPLVSLSRSISVTRWRSKGNQPELSSLSLQPCCFSKHPATERVAGEWQLFGNTTWNMLAACQGSRGEVGWGQWHHLPFSWTSTSRRSDWSSSLLLTFLHARGLHFALHSLSCAQFFFLLSLLAPFSHGIKFQAALKNRGDALEKKG